MTAVNTPAIRAELLQMLAAEQECRAALDSRFDLAFLAHFQALARSARRIRRLLRAEDLRKAERLAAADPAPPRGGRPDRPRGIPQRFDPLSETTG